MNEGILWYDVYTGYSHLSSKAAKSQTEKKIAMPGGGKRRMSLLTNEQMLEL